MKPLWKRRVYPEAASRLYFLAYLWPSKRAMLTHCRRAHLHASPDTAAQCSTYSVERIRSDGRRQTQPILGEINFYAGRITTEIVAHEIAHAALGWARRIHLDLDASPTPGRVSQGLVSDADERYCYALGRMVAQLNDHLHRLGGYA